MILIPINKLHKLLNQIKINKIHNRLILLPIITNKTN
jgi:hypothetical protein